MTVFTIKLADTVISADTVYESARKYCRNYLCEDEPEVFIKVTREDIIREQEYMERREEYLEILALYRKIAEALLDRDVILFHCSAIAVDGSAYLFAAPSGTGKSTHARLWRETLKDHEVVMVNDDKPLVRVTETKSTVYGTPWMGKHHLGNNICADIRSVCFLRQGRENVIEEMAEDEILPALLTQVYRPEDPAKLQKTLVLLSLFAKNAKFYKMSCNISEEAAWTSWRKMSGETE